MPLNKKERPTRRFTVRQFWQLRDVLAQGALDFDILRVRRRNDRGRGEDNEEEKRVANW